MCTKTHKGLVVGLKSDHLAILRGLIGGYSLPFDGSAMAVAIEEPRLAVVDRGRTGNGYPNLLVVTRSSGSVFSALVEVKRTPKDLLSSRQQYAKYLGSTSAFFIAMPSDLLYIAVAEIRYPWGLMMYKGVINADNGDIVILPRIQSFDPVKSFTFLAEAFARGGRGGRVGGVEWRTLDMLSVSGHDDYVSFDDMMVHRTYLPIVEDESQRLYPRETYYNRYAWRH